MSYDLRIIDRKGDTVTIPSPHNITGGMYQLGGSRELWLNITCNYAPIFRKVFEKYRTENKRGIRVLEGVSVKESKPMLREAISQLGDDVNDNYWDATEGNVKKSLENLLKLADLCPDGDYIWEIT